MKKWMALILGIVLVPVAFNASGTPDEKITVSAAISLKNAFEEIGKLFEARNKNATLVFNFGSSGDLMFQIKGGAPVDVFASASLEDMDKLDGEGLIIKDTNTRFASNTIVLIRPSSSAVMLSSFEDLANAEVKKVAVGNAKTVPAGKYADEVFQYMKIAGVIKKKLVFAENVKQVLDYVARGEVDAGVVYATDAIMIPREVTIVATAPAESHKPVVYPIAVVKGTKSEKTAKAFIAFLTSDEGMKILKKYGFKPVHKAKQEVRTTP
jgi:molybdate transport system substrate-binding protein